MKIKMERDDLPARMINLADTSGYKEEHELRVWANKLEEACDKYWQNPPQMEVGKFLGIYARARRIWCEYSGEGLWG